jgi:hypothetical protein
MNGFEPNQAPAWLNSAGTVAWAQIQVEAQKSAPVRDLETAAGHDCRAGRAAAVNDVLRATGRTLSFDSWQLDDQSDAVRALRELEDREGEYVRAFMARAPRSIRDQARQRLVDGLYCYITAATKGWLPIQQYQRQQARERDERTGIAASRIDDMDSAYDRRRWTGRG